MKFHLEKGEGRNTFTGYGEGWVQVGTARYTESLLVSGDQLVTDWPVESIEGLAAGHLAAIAELRPDIVLLGTGTAFRFPEPALLAPLYQAGIGVEVMDTPAACRTFNILLAEGRNVVAAVVV